MTPRCENCRFWDTSFSNDELSVCRVRPPVVAINQQRGAWPMTEDCDWCGEFQPEPPKPSPRPDCLICKLPDAECECVPF